jgi:hypothetical protein
MDENSPRHLAAAKVRGESVRAQLSSALTLCDITETEIKLGHTDQARLAVQKLRHIAGILGVHIHERGHVPNNEVSDMTEQLNRLHVRIIDLEQKAA